MPLPSAPVKRLRNLDDALGISVPALRCMGVVVEIAAYPHQPGAFGESKMPAHRRIAPVAVEFRQLGAIDEVGAPFALDMRAAVEHIVGIGMGMASHPDINRAGMRADLDDQR